MNFITTGNDHNFDLSGELYIYLSNVLITISKKFRLINYSPLLTASPIDVAQAACIDAIKNISAIILWEKYLCGWAMKIVNPLVHKLLVLCDF